MQKLLAKPLLLVFHSSEMAAELQPLGEGDRMAPGVDRFHIDGASNSMEARGAHNCD